MQKREQTLAAVFGGAIGLFVVVPGLWSWFNGPVDDLQARLDNEVIKRDKRDQELTQTLTKQRRLKEWKGRSLSPRPQEAALQYQQWLTDLAEVVAEFSNVQVAPEATSATAKQQFAVIRFRLKAEATLAQIRLFLFRFQQADLMHGVTSMSLESPMTSGNPRLFVNMQFEAISLTDAPSRGATLFPRTEIADNWEDPTQPLVVNSTEGFPVKAPFIIRCGANYFEVRDVSGSSWTIVPEQNSVTTGKVELVEDETVELVQVHPEYNGRKLADFEPILRKHPFVKPVPYAPKLEFVGAKSVSQGGSLEIQAKATGFDLLAGDPVFALEGEKPTGLMFDHRSGKLTWRPDSEQELGDVKFKVVVQAAGLKEPLADSLVLTLKQLNKAPAIETIGERHAVLGREFTFPIKATDDDPDAKLTFSLAAGAPEGAKVDAATGEFKWTPPNTSVPGPIKLTVQVADTGNPPMTSTQEFTVNVGDDLAQFTVLTGIIVRDGKKEFWLSDKSTNKRLVLHEGEPLKYADVDATVLRISPKFILLKKDETTWQLDLGENLKSLRKLDSPKAADAPTVEPVKENKAT